MAGCPWRRCRSYRCSRESRRNGLEHQRRDPVPTVLSPPCRLGLRKRRCLCPLRPSRSVRGRSRHLSHLGGYHLWHARHRQHGRALRRRWPRRPDRPRTIVGPDVLWSRRYAAVVAGGHQRLATHDFRTHLRELPRRLRRALSSADGRLFGGRNASGIIGILYTAGAVGTLVGPKLAGDGFDLFHSYSQPILVSAGCALVAACFILLLPKPTTHDAAYVLPSQSAE